MVPAEPPNSCVHFCRGKLKMEEELRTLVPRLKLGTQGLEVSKLGLGCASLSGYYNAPLSYEAGCSLIIDAFGKGITFFDTSDAYGAEHHNELMIGKALKQIPRDKVQVATKFGFVLDENGVRILGDPKYVRACCEASIKRLDVDYIDLYYQHRVDKSVPIEDTMGELKKLVEEGKIKYIGLSEASPNTIRRAHAVHPITAVQMEYSLWSRDIEEQILPLCRVLDKRRVGEKIILDDLLPSTCRELGIGIVAYCPLGRGFFGGKGVLESLSKDTILGMVPRFVGENLEKNKLLYNRLANLAAKHGCTLPQLALAWILHQGDDVVPIPGTTKIKNQDNNISALEIKLTKADLKEISDAVPIDEVAGNRNPEILADYVWQYADTPLEKG
ncbi:hypothetical protein Syun_029408 [Stephania yunnanensis]|uniref:NADP-dependent oxidoreductase domain-containing protein n=1 Tax=Stephania yunnanensis TaxID=152371 RepID=A0AAP0HH99_9MAGN